jgi:hypothetical protein
MSNWVKRKGKTKVKKCLSGRGMKRGLEGYSIGGKREESNGS